MQCGHPPKALPSGFAEIWQALKAADLQAASRQALARQLRVSTQTLQRILVSGEVPIFPQTRNRRVLHAWARTLTRLAVHFDHQPRIWLEMVGIPWDDRIQRVTQATLRDFARPPSIGPRIPRPYGGLTPESIPAAEGMERMQLPVGLVEYGPFSRPLPSFSGSFLELYIRRLMGAIDASARLHLHTMEDSQLASEMIRHDTPLCLGVGLWETTHRRSMGLDFLSIPGWRVRLSAICIRRLAERRQPPGWPEAIATAARNDCDLLLPTDDLARQYLVGQCGFSANRLLDRTASNATALAQTFLQETRRRPRRWVILVSDEETCRQTMGSLERAEGFAEFFSVQELSGAAKAAPSYQLAIALGAGSEKWRALLKAARDRELFGVSHHQTAQLYAELIVAGLLESRGFNPLQRDNPPAAWKPVDFPQATAEFQVALCLHLLSSLEEQLSLRLETQGDPGDPQALRIYAKGLAAMHAAHLIPRAWRGSLREVLDAGQPIPAQGETSPATPPRYCRSCAVSLLDEHNRGISDRYCRYCSDEQGRLKPRREVQRLIAGWMMHWQDNLSTEEAQRRAAHLMQAMPAWNKN